MNFVRKVLRYFCIMKNKKGYIKKMVTRTNKSPRELASCYGKMRYVEYKDAKIMAEKLSYANQHPYRCEFCGCYHIGRRSS